MTTEEDFQRRLDAVPQDWQTRLIFADWLQDRDDRRAEGYRALGVLRRVPRKFGSDERPFFSFAEREALSNASLLVNEFCRLPKDWFRGIPRTTLLTTINAYACWRDYRRRRSAENAAARAFLRLAAERRAALLRGEM